MQIFIVLPDDNKITLKVKSSDTTDSVIGKIQEKEEFAQKELHLQAENGQLLLPGEPLKNYNIKDKGMLHLCVISEEVDAGYGIFHYAMNFIYYLTSGGESKTRCNKGVIKRFWDNLLWWW